MKKYKFNYYHANGDTDSVDCPVATRNDAMIVGMNVVNSSSDILRVVVFEPVSSDDDYLWKRVGTFYAERG